jgi:hypothetical protein
VSLIGKAVTLIGQGSRAYIVTSSEVHNELVFYRVKGLRGALFLRSSLKLV